MKGKGSSSAWLSAKKFHSQVLMSSIVLVFLCSACTRANEVERQAAAVTGGNPHAGKQAIRRYGCYTCHTIPGVDGAEGLVGPPLAQIGNRYMIAGELPNTASNIERWIQHPRQVEPHTLMPEMGVTDQDSRDIAAYLYTLR